MRSGAKFALRSSKASLDQYAAENDIFSRLAALVLPLGLTGICLTLVGASFVRMAVSYYALTKLIRADKSQPTAREVVVQGDA